MSLFQIFEWIDGRVDNLPIIAEERPMARGKVGTLVRPLPPVVM